MLPSRLAHGSSRRAAAFAAALVLTLALLAGVPSPARAGDRSDLDVARALGRAGRWAASESLATVVRARLESQPRPDSLLLAEVLEHYSNSRQALHELGDSRTFDAVALAIGIRSRHAGEDDVPPEWNSLAARILRDSDELDRALAFAQAGAAHFERPGRAADTTAVDAYAVLASVQRYRETWPEAIAAYEHVLRMQEVRSGADSPGMATRLTDFGATLTESGDLDRAREVLHRAIAIFERDRRANAPTLGIAYANLSSTERLAGDLAESVELMRRGYELLSERYGETSLQALRLEVNLAFRMILLGDNPGAIVTFRRCLPQLITRVGASNSNVLEARVAMANAFAAVGDTAAAFEQLDSTDAAIRGLPAGRVLPQEAFARISRSRLLEARGHHREARVLGAVALTGENETTDPDGGRRAEVLGTLFDTIHAAADSSVLDSTCRAAARLESTTVVRKVEGWLALGTARARAESRLGRSHEAWAHALEAESFARRRFQLSVQALPDRRALGLQELLGQPLDLVLALAGPDSPEQTRIAWDRLVRWRGLVRAELAERRPPLGGSADTTSLRAHDDWVAKQQRYARLVVAETGELPSTRLETARLESEEAERRWGRVARGGAGADSISLDRVLSALPAGAAMFAFAEVGAGGPAARMVAFVKLAGGAPQLLNLGDSAAIRDAIGAWREALGASPSGDPRGAGAAERSVNRAGEAVRAAVWDPLRRLAPGARTIVIVGDGPVLDLPWSALPMGSHGYLAESDVELHVLESEREWVGHAASVAGRGLLAVGDPAFGGSPAAGAPGTLLALRRAAAGNCARLRPLVLSALPGARDEARDVAEIWRAHGAADSGDVELLLGGDAGEAAFRRDAPGRRLIHLATHGVVVDDSCFGTSAAGGTRGLGGVDAIASGTGRRRPGGATVTATAAPTAPAALMPRRVWLAFAGAASPHPPAGDQDDGLLTAEEVVTLDLRGVDWVVLSACHSSAGENWPHEGALGMRRAFHMAGARSVIASGWSVDDAATREWMHGLYAARNAGSTDADAAVRAADRTVLAARRREGRTTHPFYWAAFTASGE